MSDPHSFNLHPNNVTKNLIGFLCLNKMAGMLMSLDYHKMSQCQKPKHCINRIIIFLFLLVVDKINADIYISFQTLYEGGSICISVRNFIHIKHEVNEL